MKFFENIRLYFTNKEILQRILVTLLILFFFRLLSKVPAPGIERDALLSLFGSDAQNSASQGFFSIANILAGGTLSNFSIISVGLFAFISASVIFQLLGPIVPQVEQLQKMGEVGRKIIDQWTRILTVPLAGIQSFALYLALKSPYNQSGRILVDPDMGWLGVTALISVLIGGTMLLIWLAELCSEKGLGGKRGGGASIIITAGILASLPTSIVGALANFSTTDYLRNFWIAFGAEWIIFFILLGIVLLLVKFGAFVANRKSKPSRIALTVLYTIILIAIPTFIIFVAKVDLGWTRELRTLWEVNTSRLDTLETRFGFFLALTFQIIAIATFFNESIRRIPIKFITRIRNKNIDKNDESSFLPVKLLQVGVMPIIFASSLLLMPAVIHRFFGDQIMNWNDSVGRFLQYAALGWLNQFDSPYYHILHFIFVVLFSLFFITIVMKPDDIANDLKGRKTFVPGVRPGDETIDFLSGTIMRVTFWGGLILGLVSVMPYLFGFYDQTKNLPLGIESLIAGGTSVLIIVPTILAVKAQMDALVLTKNYEKFEEI